MARSRSSIRQLPDPIRDEVDRLLLGGRHTIDQITAHLQELGHPRSRSAVGRYAQQFERISEDIRRTREMARALGRELSDIADGGDATQMIVESLHSLLLRANLQLADDEFKPKDVADLARAAKDLSLALKSSVDTGAAVRRQLAEVVRRQAEEAGDAVEALARESGVSEARAAELRRRVLGIRVPDPARTAG